MMFGIIWERGRGKDRDRDRDRDRKRECPAEIGHGYMPPAFSLVLQQK
jgi:hypothetical protein